MVRFEDAEVNTLETVNLVRKGINLSSTLTTDFPQCKIWSRRSPPYTLIIHKHFAYPRSHQLRLHKSDLRIWSRTPWCTTVHILSRTGPDTQRLASTNARPTTPVAEIQPSYPADTVLPVSDNPSAFPSTDPISTPDAFGDLYNDGVQPTYEYIGWLHDLGIDYGIGPTSMTQFVLEHIHIWGGLPWWASIGLTVIGVRAALFKLYINASDNSARLAAIAPLLEPVTARIKAAQRNRDTQAMMKASQDRKVIMQEAGASTLRSIYPIMFQIPAGIGMFRLMNGMTGLPVPGLDEGGFLWLSDLTVRDPLFIMPIVTALVFHLTFRFGGEMGNASTMSPGSFRVFSYFLPALSGIFAIWWPAGLQIPIFTSGLISMVQAYLFGRPWFRNFFGMQPVLAKKAQPPGYRGTINTGHRESERKGMVGDLKQAYADAVKRGKAMTGEDTASRKKTTPARTTIEARKAKDYEASKAREAAQRRFEALQAKKSEEEDKRARKPL